MVSINDTGQAEPLDHEAFLVLRVRILRLVDNIVVLVVLVDTSVGQVVVVYVALAASVDFTVSRSGL